MARAVRKVSGVDPVQDRQSDKVLRKVETRSAEDVVRRTRKVLWSVRAAWAPAFHAANRATRRATIAAANAHHSVRHR